MFLGAPCLPLSIGKSLAGGGRFPASPLAPALALLFPERTQVTAWGSRDSSSRRKCGLAPSSKTHGPGLSHP